MDPHYDTTDSQATPRHNLPTHKGTVIQPLPGQTGREPDNPAVDLIRHKLETLYQAEPSAKEERAEANAVTHRSPHQEFMFNLSHSGKSLAEIQTEWHNYYVNLPDEQKHQVWQEFYAAHDQQSASAAHSVQPPDTAANADTPAQDETPVATPAHTPRPKHRHSDVRTVTEIKSQLLSKVQTRAKVNKKDHLKALLFGLGAGLFVLAILLFGFFNERFIAPFMTPSRALSSTPLIIDPSSTVVGKDPKLIIPKINVEIPVVYDEPSIGEAAVQTALERGVVHYATTPLPGELGNGVIFGHSANNLLNKGKYKFAFVLLHKLELGDTFYVEKNGKRYVYKVFEKKVVSPKAVEVLYNTAKPASLTLITCDPPGTSLNRLVVVGEQISPDPGANTASSVTPDVTTPPQELPSNSPTLWSRFVNWLTN